MQVVAATKKARTQEVAAVKPFKNGLFVQSYQKDKTWSLQMHPWQYVDSPCFNLKLREEHNMGINICGACNGDAPELVTLLPYGPLATKCTGRDGCGAALQRGLLDIESIVRLMFLVGGPNETTEPCWLAASIVENHRDNYQHRAETYN